MYELWIGRVPIVLHLCIFEFTIYIHISKARRSKLDPKNVKAIFVGYCTNTKAYQLWNMQQQKMMISRNVIFDKLSLPGQSTPVEFSGLSSVQ